MTKRQAITKTQILFYEFSLIILILSSCSLFLQNYYNNYMPLSFMGLITGKKIKTHTSQGIVKNKCTKPTKEWLGVDRESQLNFNLQVSIV
jgi:hypothetical protein